MTACRSYRCRWWVAAVLATGVLTGAKATAIEGIVWAPSRDDAPIGDALPGASHIEPADYTSEVLPEPAMQPGSRLRSQRPSGLARPAPWQSRQFVAEGAVTAETLPPPRSRAGTRISPEGLPVPEGEMFLPEGEIIGDEYGLAGDPECCGAGCCEPNCCGDWNSCGPVPIWCLLPRPNLQGFEAIAGVQGFTGPANRGGSGSFGFQEGFNWGMPLCGGCVSAQVGMLWTQSNFDGNFITPDMRNQRFLTGGLFRRVDWGLQGGVAVDYLHDEWDYQIDLAQVRGELSWKFCGPNEVGFWFTTGIADDAGGLRQPVEAGEDTFRMIDTEVEWESNDLYAFFLRRQFACGGEGRVFGGFTGYSQGLMGADFTLPLNPCWSARAGFLYLTPEDNEDAQLPDFVQETWNVSIQLVWTPFKRIDGCANYSRALLNVADNGSFATRYTTTQFNQPNPQ